jgi:hypothetical protein
MKLTKSYLRKIIKEEIENTMEGALDDAASGFVGGDEPEYTGPDLSNLLQDFEETIQALIKAATTGAAITPEKDKELTAVFQTMVKARNLLRKYLDEEGPSGDRMGLKGMGGNDMMPRSRGRHDSEKYNQVEE